MEESPITILIVDDDSDDHDFLNMAIDEVIPGANVISVFDGAQALDFLKDHKKNHSRLPDLVFLDINMHKMDGRVATRLIRTDPFFDSLPIIILSTGNASDASQEFLTLGANGIYTKQSNIPALVSVIQDVNARFLLSSKV